PRAGKRIPNEQRPPRSPEAVAEALRLWKEQRPYAELRSRGSAVYNCLGLVFGSRRTCIDSEYTERILNEDGYRPVQDPEQPTVGDVVLYRRPDREIAHVGWIVSNES